MSQRSVLRPQQQTTGTTPGPTRHRLAHGPLLLPFRGHRYRDGEDLRLEGAPALYVIEQVSQGRTVQRGVIGALDLGSADGSVIPHENIIPAKVDLQYRIARMVHGYPEPIMLASSGGVGARGLAAVTLRAPDQEFTSPEGTTHRLWACTDHDEQRSLTEGLDRAPVLIADGHHRFEAALRCRREFRDHRNADRVPALLVDTDLHPLRLSAIHRWLPNLDPAWAIARLSRGASVTEWHGPARDPVPGEFILTGKGRTWSVSAVDRGWTDQALARHPSAWRDLGTVILHHLLIDRVWASSRAGEDIRYIHDSAVEYGAPPSEGTLVLLAPPALNHVRDLAESGTRLPHKTTSFEPKPLPWQLYYRWDS